MRLLKEKPSKNVQVYQQPNWEGKGDRMDKAGKGPRKDQGRIYDSPDVRAAIDDISAEFQSKIGNRPGKGDRPRPALSKEAIDAAFEARDARRRRRP